MIIELRYFVNSINIFFDMSFMQIMIIFHAIVELANILVFVISRTFNTTFAYYCLHHCSRGQHWFVWLNFVFENNFRTHLELVPLLDFLFCYRYISSMFNWNKGKTLMQTSTIVYAFTERKWWWEFPKWAVRTYLRSSQLIVRHVAVIVMECTYVSEVSYICKQGWYHQSSGPLSDLRFFCANL